MSAPALLHLPAQVVQWLLVGAGVGSDPTALVNGALGAWPVYADREPDGDGVPDEVLTVYDVDGSDDGQSMTDGEPFQHFGFQVRVRSKAADVGRAKAEAVRKFLAQLPRYAAGTADVTVPARAEGQPAASYRVYNFSRVVPVRRVGQETGKTRRHLFTVNAVAPVRRTSPPQPSALYRFDGNLLDSSGNGKHLAGTGAEGYADGASNRGLDRGAPTRAQDVLTGNPTTGTYSVVIRATRRATGSYTLAFANGNGDPSLSVTVSSGNVLLFWTDGGQANFFGETVDQNESYLLVTVVTGGNSRTYYNVNTPVQYALTPVPGADFAAGGTGALGLTFFGTTGAFVVEEVVVLNGVALTDAEVAAMVAGGLPYPP